MTIVKQAEWPEYFNIHSSVGVQDNCDVVTSICCLCLCILQCLCEWELIPISVLSLQCWCFAAYQLSAHLLRVNSSCRDRVGIDWAANTHGLRPWPQLCRSTTSYSLWGSCWAANESRLTPLTPSVLRVMEINVTQLLLKWWTSAILAWERWDNPAGWG